MPRDKRQLLDRGVRMKILYVVHEFPPNATGTGIATCELSKEMAKRNDVYVLYPVAREGLYTLNSYKKNGLRVYELAMSLGIRIRKMTKLKMSCVDGKVEKRFREILEDVKPDVIHFQHLVMLSASLIKVAKEREIPVVLTLHDYWFICPRAQLLKYDYTVCAGPDEECSNCFNKGLAEEIAGFLENYAIPRSFSKKAIEIVLKLMNRRQDFVEGSKYMKTLLLEVDKIIVPSNFLRGLFLNYEIPGDKMVFLENGMSLTLFRGFRKRRKKKLCFGFVGGILKHKGVHVLIEAFNKISSNNVELRVYGYYDENSEFFKGLNKKIKNTNIKFLGGFSDIRNPYSEIDILVVPSIWYETGGPLVVKEAFATGTPVIASNIGCIPEFVVDGVNGLLFETGNAEDLHRKIMMILEDPSLIGRLQKNISPPRSIKDQSKEIEELYVTLR
jgi:glycosyltransferase involved in cell wall biosynthesis